MDLDLLRTLILVAEEGGFARAAERVGRTQSAVSRQVRRLEALVGHTLLSRGKGGGVEFTTHGAALVDRGRALLALNDEILQSLQSHPVRSAVRLGAPDDYPQLYLSKALARFAQTHPDVTVELSRAPSCQLTHQLKDGHLDLMVCEGGLEPRQWPTVELQRMPLKWITSERHAKHLEETLPLSLSPGNCPWRPLWLDECLWRGSALRALQRAGRKYKIVSTSSSIVGQQAAVLAGLAVMVSTPDSLPAGLRAVGPDEGLPDLPETSLSLLKAREPRRPATDALAAHFVEVFSLNMQNV